MNLKPSPSGGDIAIQTPSFEREALLDAAARRRERGGSREEAKKGKGRVREGRGITRN